MIRKIAKYKVEEALKKGGVIYFGDFRGYYIGNLIQNFARKCGCPKKLFNGSFGIDYYQETEKAVEWLNDHVLPSGYMFVLDNDFKIERVEF